MNPTPLAEDQVVVAGLAIDGPDVFWTGWGSTNALDPTGFLATVPKAGGTPVILSSRFTGPSDVAVFGSEVFFLTGEVCRIPRTGGDCEFIAWYSGPLPGSEVYSMNGPAGLVTDGAKLFWSNSNDGNIVSVDLPAGGEPSAIAREQKLPFHLAHDDGHVYWTTTEDAGMVARAPKAGGDTEVLTESFFGSGLATDGDRVYFAASDGTVRSVPNSGGEAIAIAGGQDTSGHFVAVDDAWVYWTNPSGTIVRAAKGP